jgi:hypothetical protein
VCLRGVKRPNVLRHGFRATTVGAMLKMIRIPRSLAFFTGVLVAAGAFASSIAACSDSATAPPSSASDAGASQDTGIVEGSVATPDASLADVAVEQQCPDLDVSSEADVAVTTVNGLPPVATGGTLAPGLYRLTGSINYVIKGTPKPPPATRKGRMLVTASELTLAVEPNVGSSRATTITYTIMGANLLAKPRCFVGKNGTATFVDGGGDAVPIPFSVTATTVTIGGSRQQTVASTPDGGTATTDESEEYFSFTR